MNVVRIYSEWGQWTMDLVQQVSIDDAARLRVIEGATMDVALVGKEVVGKWDPRRGRGWLTMTMKGAA